MAIEYLKTEYETKTYVTVDIEKHFGVRNALKK